MDHQTALTLLDTTLIPKATDVDIRSALTAARAKVDMHLQMALMLQSKLGG